MPTNLTYDFVNKDFVYKFLPDAENSQPTEIYVPPLSFPNSQFNLDLSSELNWSLSPNDPNIVLITLQKTPSKVQQTKHFQDPVFVHLSPVVQLNVPRAND